MQAVLVMFRSDGERRSFSITRDVTSVGRSEESDLRIPLGDVSRKHARLVREGDQMRLEDLGSSNGTFLNGARVERDAYLQAGDSIQVGPVVFVLQVDGYPADEELNPITAEAAAAAAMVAGQGGEAGATDAGLGGDGMEPLEAIEPAGVEASGGLGDLDPLPDLGDQGPAGDGGMDPAGESAGGGHGELEPIPLAAGNDDYQPVGRAGAMSLSDDDGLDQLNDPSPPKSGAGADDLDDLLLDIEPEPPKGQR